MIAHSQNLFHKKGTDFLDSLAVENPLTGLPFNLANCDAVLEGRVGVTDAVPAFTLSTDAGTITLSDSENTLSFAALSAFWTDIDAAQYVFSLLLTDDSSNVYCIYEGIFYLGE
jgi:hypothetical protein